MHNMFICNLIKSLAFASTPIIVNIYRISWVDNNDIMLADYDDDGSLSVCDQRVRCEYSSKYISPQAMTVFSVCF